jgi:hypothetical protein
MIICIPASLHAQADDESSGKLSLMERLEFQKGETGKGR